MNRRPHWLWRPSLLAAALLLASSLLVGGCTKKPPKATPRYQPLPAKTVPAFMQGTVYEKANLVQTEPFAVSGFGLVVNLRGTGDSYAPSAVREYMIRQMVKHGFGQHSVPGYQDRQPEDVLRDPRVAIVRVDGFIPPGTRANDMFDVQVSALEQSATTSLAHGQLFETDLTINGANDVKPGTAVNVLARALGPVFVNPAYSLSSKVPTTQQASLRYGVVMNGGMATQDYPLALRLVQPQFSVSRALENRIDERFQEVADVPKKSGQNRMGVAAAIDDGIVQLYVPRAYRGDWEHFSGVVMHLYLNRSPDFAVAKAKELAAEAVKPDAPLMDISYCWEGLGTPALPFVLPLMTHASPEVAFAAARAAAFIGDESGSAQVALMQMARTPDHPFQLNAVQVLGAMPASPRINQMLRELLASRKSLVRVEAYKVLARNRDSAVFSKVIREKFVLDIVPSDGTPLVFATRQGTPRLALIGPRPVLGLPLTFTAMDSTLSISGEDGSVTIFYRGNDVPEPTKITSRPDLAEIVARFGGEGPKGLPRLDLSYGDIVAIVQAMTDANKLVATTAEQKTLPVSFMLQEMPVLQDSVYNAPIIPDARPQEEDPRASRSD